MNDNPLTEVREKMELLAETVEHAAKLVGTSEAEAMLAIDEAVKQADELNVTITDALKLVDSHKDVRLLQSAYEDATSQVRTLKGRLLAGDSA